MTHAKKTVLVLWLLTMSGPTIFSQSSGLSKILDDLRSSDSEVRLEAARNLPNVWQTAADRASLVEQLAPLLSSADEHVRLAVLATFEQICLMHPDEAPTIAKSKLALIEASTDSLEDVRQYATAVMAITLPASDEDLKKAVIRGLSDPGHKVRKVALGAVSFRKLNDPEIVTAVLALASFRPEELARTTEALGNAAPTDRRAVGMFVNSLSNDSADVKSQSLLALQKSGKAASEALPRLRQIAADPEESQQIRRLAAEAIKKIE
jgi:HEAT repeat protein